MDAAGARYWPLTDEQARGLAGALNIRDAGFILWRLAVVLAGQPAVYVDAATDREAASSSVVALTATRLCQLMFDPTVTESGAAMDPEAVRVETVGLSAISRVELLQGWDRGPGFLGDAPPNRPAHWRVAVDGLEGALVLPHLANRTALPDEARDLLLAGLVAI